MKDTTAEIEALVRRRYLAMTPVERLVIGAQMFETARAMVLASFPPALSPDETRLRLCRRLYGDLADQAYGPAAFASAIRAETAPLIIAPLKPPPNRKADASHKPSTGVRAEGKRGMPCGGTTGAKP